MMSMNTTGFADILYIVKGQYRKNLPPKFFNEVSETENSIGGFNPNDPATEEWYMVQDNIYHMCHGAGSNLEEALKVVSHIITTYRTPDAFLTAAREYHVNTSRSTCRLMEEVLKTFGNPFRADIERAIQSTYKQVKENHPAAQARSRFKRREVKLNQELDIVKQENQVVSAVPRPKKGKLLKPVKRNR